MYYLSGLFAILWFEPTRVGEQRVLPLAIVTTFDLLALLIFLFRRQIGRLHANHASDIEQGRTIAQDNEGLGKEQVERRTADGKPETPPSERLQIQAMRNMGYDISAVNRCGRDFGSLIVSSRGSANRQSGVPARSGSSQSPGGPIATEEVIQSPGSAWPMGTLQPVREVQEMGDGSQIPKLYQPRRVSTLVLGLGMDAGSLGFNNIQSPVSLVSPSTIFSSDIHPVFRPVPSSPELPCRDNSRRREIAIIKGTNSWEPNQI
jgi:hypothetical protein